MPAPEYTILDPYWLIKRLLVDLECSPNPFCLCGLAKCSGLHRSDCVVEDARQYLRDTENK